MAVCELSDGTLIGDFLKPYIVAEVNSSHGGNLDVAKEMINRAVESGCNCVKFQSWSEESLYSKTYYDQNPISKRIIKKFSFSKEKLLAVSEYCRVKKIAFSSTPYSKEEVDFLVEKCQIPFIKIASMELNNLPFIDYIAKTNVPIVLSTGMGELEEIQRAVRIIEKSGNKNLCILHCISIYPPKFETINLNNILGLRDVFPNYPIGFSDHSLGLEISSAATALGAALIEKHFTLDKKGVGMDNQMAIEPGEMSQLVQNCENIHLALGNRTRIVSDAEVEKRTQMRRSIISTRDLRAGSILLPDDLDVKRPGTGIGPEQLQVLIGKKLVRDIEKDSLIFIEDVK